MVSSAFFVTSYHFSLDVQYPSSPWSQRAKVQSPNDGTHVSLTKSIHYLQFQKWDKIVSIRPVSSASGSTHSQAELETVPALATIMKEKRSVGKLLFWDYGLLPGCENFDANDFSRSEELTWKNRRTFVSPTSFVGYPAGFIIADGAMIGPRRLSYWFTITSSFLIWTHGWQSVSSSKDTSEKRCFAFLVACSQIQSSFGYPSSPVDPSILQ